MKHNFTKYINENISSPTEHWEYCQRYKIPYISVKSAGKNKAEIFYDITDLPVDLQEISEKVRTFYKAYHSFFLLNEYFGKKYEDNTYFFTFVVLSEHSNCIANQLFDFLMSDIY